MRRLALLTAVSATAALLLLPSAAPAAGIIGSLSIAPGAVRDGASATGTVTLAAADPTADTTVLLFSSDPSIATVPASIDIPAGATSGTFTIATSATAPPDSAVQIQAWVGSTPRFANLGINASRPAGPFLSAVSSTPSTLTGGSPATGTVTFSAPTVDGAGATLSSSDPALVQVPSSVLVRRASATGAFPITTAPVSATTTVTITASWFDITRTTTITLVPGAPAAPDRVGIDTATWSKGLLTIRATSSNPNAILSVYSSSGTFMFTLTSDGRGRYSDQRGWLDNPRQIEVRSNLGGSATAVLKS